MVAANAPGILVKLVTSKRVMLYQVRADRTRAHERDMRSCSFIVLAVRKVSAK
jgi:hypothetical protein